MKGVTKVIDKKLFLEIAYIFVVVRILRAFYFFAGFEHKYISSNRNNCLWSNYYLAIMTSALYAHMILCNFIMFGACHC